MRRLLGGRKDLFVVIVGANDGKLVDPIYPLLRRNRSWQALLIEPVPYLFERLKRNYGKNSRFRYARVAIADCARTMPFYYVSEEARREVPHAPILWEAIGSFNRANLEKHLAGPYDRFIVEEMLEAIPLATVLERERVARIDVLIIDAEGYDWEVLKQLDLKCFSPLVIFYEHKLLSSADKAACRQMLHNYEIEDLGYDDLCVRRA
jgi:FkbM family methyltransferase